jgi:hypothetical protein
MATTSTSILADQGTGKVDLSITPQMRTGKPLYLKTPQAQSMQKANVFFQDYDFTHYTQHPTPIQVNTANTAISNTLNMLLPDIGVYQDSTKIFAKVTATANDKIHLNQNFIGIQIEPYGSNTSLSAAVNQHKVGDVIYLTSSATDKDHANSHLKGTVEHLNPTDGIIHISIDQASQGNGKGPAAILGGSSLVIHNMNESKGSVLANANTIISSKLSNTGNLTFVNTHEGHDPVLLASLPKIPASAITGFYNYGFHGANTSNTSIGNKLPNSTNNHLHLSGHFFFPNANLARVITLTGPVDEYETVADDDNWALDLYPGLSITIVNGPNAGESANIVSVVQNKTYYPGTIRNTQTANDYATLTLDKDLRSPKTNSYYFAISNTSQGRTKTDNDGNHHVILHIPDGDNIKLTTGKTTITVTDGHIANSNSAKFHGTGKYTTTGVLDASSDERSTPDKAIENPSSGSDSVKQSSNPADLINKSTPSYPVANTTVTTPTTASLKQNMAQTFFTPKPKSAKQNYGIYITSVVLFFSKKPDLANTGIPGHTVGLSIVPTVNGYPTGDELATTHVEWRDITVSKYPEVGNSATQTVFTFDDPVYVEADREYAFVVKAKANDYQLYTANLGDNAILNPSLASSISASNTAINRKVSEQPSVGNLFLAQNSSLWNPIANQDLMFVIRKAQFNTSGRQIAYYNMKPLSTNTFYDQIVLTTSDLHFPIASINYYANTVLAKTLTHDTQLAQLTPNKVYDFAWDLRISNAASTRRRVFLKGDAESINVSVEMNSTDPDVTPAFNYERLNALAFENTINYGQLYSSYVTVTNRGSLANLSNVTATVSSPDLSDGFHATINVANCIFTTSGSANLLSQIVFDSAGAGYLNTPTITFASTLSGDSSTDVVPTVKLIGEDGKYGGIAFCRYVTKKITLADGFDSGDLRVYLHAIKPFGTKIFAYFKVKSIADSEDFSSKSWIPMGLLKDNVSADKSTPVDLEFRPLSVLNNPSSPLSYIENGITYPIGGTFKEFAVKLVLYGQDVSVHPEVLNFRAIALPAG